MKIDLKNKIILVTGASRGIGKGIAELLAESGATVAVHYNKNSKLVEQLTDKLGNNAKAFQADLSSPEACKKLFENVLKNYDKIDVLVNNAGIFLNSPLNRPSWLDDWNLTLDVNLRAAALLSRFAILHFQKTGGGRIINISSRAAFRGDNPEHLAYAASKAGMVALTKSVARCFGNDGITSFVVAPGWVETDMNKETIERFGDDEITRDLALDRLTQPGDLAPIIVLLASGLADHATGTTIDINAGSYVH
jgi:3-oxoacyl-[acyl-carrier protein] reductase